MSDASGLQGALAFIHAARTDEDLQRELEALSNHVSPDDIVSIAARAGYRFTADELQRAHALDWRMRWSRFHAA
jgi:predicted ribosomally synthesized peptide with nif11-like leader